MATDVCVALGKRIRELRKAKGWRQIDLAQHSGVHEVHISDLERGSREVGLRTLCSLARALGISPSEMLKGISSSLMDTKACAPDSGGGVR
jgi:XRE family aerobic/anaerobic benzoate catabolism transcriptional regulator